MIDLRVRLAQTDLGGKNGGFEVLHHAVGDHPVGDLGFGNGVGDDSHGWGAKEIMITHNTEVLVFDGREIYTCPIKARNLSGRTGRGDTTFAGYVNERLTSDIPAALRFATALVSLKMETPGAFCGTRADVDEYIRLFY